MAGSIPATSGQNYYLQQAQIFFGRPVTQTEFDKALPTARLGHIFSNWIKGKAYLQTPSVTHAWQFVHYYHQWRMLSNGRDISPVLQRFEQIAAASGASA